MNARTWIAIVLSCLVWFVYMRWFSPTPAMPTGTPSASVGQNVPVTDAAGKPATTTAAPTGENLVSGLPAEKLFPEQPSFSLDAPKARILFAEGAGKPLASDLKLYHVTIQPDSPLISLLGPGFSRLSAATIFTEDDLKGLSSATYKRDGEMAKFAMVAENPIVAVRKTYDTAAGNYLTHFRLELKFADTRRRNWGYWYLPIGRSAAEHKGEDPMHAWEVVYYQNESVNRVDMEKLPATPEIKQGNTGYLAFGNRYFTTTFAHRGGINPDVVLVRDTQFAGAYLRYPIVLKDGEQTVAYDLDLYMGPKDYADLAQVPGLRQVINYGFFSFVAYPLLELLRFFNRFVANYGIAIILLTLLVRILFYPLALKSFKSMKAMQKIQPQLTALKEKYKDDPERFGREQLALFKTHKVNPAGGCLPMLVQLPVFFALYSVLQNSIELFHAPFFGWIRDLSSKDPLYIFPVLMGISMFVQQKMTPAAGMDPAQQKVLLIMPVIFSFMMFSLPSGLTVYIFLSTLLGIGQQLLMNRGQGTSEGNSKHWVPAKT